MYITTTSQQSPLADIWWRYCWHSSKKYVSNNHDITIAMSSTATTIVHCDAESRAERTTACVHRNEFDAAAAINRRRCGNATDDET
jgi:hypothetical protein